MVTKKKAKRLTKKRDKVLYCIKESDIIQMIMANDCDLKQGKEIVFDEIDYIIDDLDQALCDLITDKLHERLDI